MVLLFFFFFNDTATTEIYTLSLHDALPISSGGRRPGRRRRCATGTATGSWRTPKRPSRSCGGHRRRRGSTGTTATMRSEEHTSELQSRQYLVCRLLLEKKKNTNQHEADLIQ